MRGEIIERLTSFNHLLNVDDVILLRLSVKDLQH
jgi:hypothetical protein